MDPLSSHEEVEIPMPINSAYVGLLHNHHHHHHNNNHHEASLDITPPASNNAPTNSREDRRQHQQSQGYHENYTDDDHPKRRVVVRYRECLKNHAATMGGNATDGCGEFMPSGPHEGGEGGGLGNLICSACNCHRNFHRKEIEGEQQQVVPHSSTTNTVPQFYPSTPHPVLLGGPRGRGVIFGTRPATTHHVDGVAPFSRTVPISIAYPASDDHSNDHHRLVRKRFRTKFSPEQKEKMMEFAERVGWKIQRQEESVVQQFCQEIGVKRRVLKVWMHNNKHNLANKIINHNHDNNNSNDNHDNNNNHSSSSM